MITEADDNADEDSYSSRADTFEAALLGVSYCKIECQ
jgi:hypothetical protein